MPHQTRQPIAVFVYALLILTAGCPGVHAAGRVAVFSEARFPFYGPPGLTSPRRIAQTLRGAGIPADLLAAPALSDSARLNIARYDAVVLPYGNTYPQSAFANLRAFHRAGGCLILSGVPFTHAVARDGDGWRDLGHDSAAALFGPNGIGVGGFDAKTRQEIKLAPGDPMGLKAVKRNWPGAAQSLDVKSLPAQTRIVPILVAGGKPIAALLVHKNDDFGGAVDAWLNAPHGDDIIRDTQETEQLLTRGTIAALAVQGILMVARMPSDYRASEDGFGGPVGKEEW